MKEFYIGAMISHLLDLNVAKVPTLSKPTSLGYIIFNKNIQNLQNFYPRNQEFRQWSP